MIYLHRQSQTLDFPSNTLEFLGAKPLNVLEGENTKNLLVPCRAINEF
jgi:hypothetical protein